MTVVEALGRITLKQVLYYPTEIYSHLIELITIIICECESEILISNNLGEKW